MIGPVLPSICIQARATTEDLGSLIPEIHLVFPFLRLSRF